ncbi:hypothetical protein [Serratia sp. PL7]|uniref:hypothetical protein n=1 Tax=Serratia sp. PL7 TaxID=2952201 RepID=UPI0021AD61EC|nr:hypothetical protein [Serratia sp. PL7]
MNNQPLPPATLRSSQQPFCIHEKLKVTGADRAYTLPDNKIWKGASYILEQDFDGDYEIALYKRSGDSFVLVDFFISIDSACEEAKEIIRNSKKLNAMFC